MLSIGGDDLAELIIFRGLPYIIWGIFHFHEKY